MNYLFSEKPYPWRRELGLEGKRPLFGGPIIFRGPDETELARMYAADGWVIMEGVTGRHCLAANTSDDERISNHWKGFRANCLKYIGAQL